MKLDLPFAVLLLCGCSLSLSLRPLPRKHGAGHHSYQQALRADTPADKFNFIDVELLQLAAEMEAGNIVMSPASVKTTLSMLFEGADGNSAEEIKLALRLSGPRERQEEQLHMFQQNLTTRSPASASAPSSVLELASQVFASNRIEVNPKYSEKLARYNAMVKRVNMSDTQHAAQTINQWVSTATRGLVPSIIQEESLSQSSIMVIANAIYFRGTWQTAFDADRTKEADFCGLPGPGSGTNCVKVEMMETTGSFRSKLISELDATLLELPYDDGRYSMLLLLPERTDGMRQMVRDLQQGSLLNVINNDLEESEYIVSIPKFSIEFDSDLVPALNKLKVVDIFTPAANLTKMIKQGLIKVEPAVSNVFHKAKVLVDERGAVAAGVSGALVVPLMGGPQPRFYADHPFLFFIRDVKTGGFLFAGRVSQPPPPPATAAATATADPGQVTPVGATPSTANRSQPLKEEIKFPNSSA